MNEKNANFEPKITSVSCLKNIKILPKKSPKIKTAPPENRGLKKGENRKKILEYNTYNIATNHTGKGLHGK